MNKMITIVVLALAFSSAHAAGGKATAKLNKIRTEQANKTTAEQAKDVATKKSVEETKDTARDKAAAVQKLAESDPKLREDLRNLFRAKEKGEITKEHYDVTLELLVQIGRAERSAGAQALSNLKIEGDVLVSQKALIGLANALLVEVKGSPAQAAVAIAAAKAANASLKAKEGIVKADAAAREAMEKKTGKKVTSRELAERCKRG